MADLLATGEQLDTARASRSGGTLRFVAGKLLGALVSLVFVIALGFFLFRVIPGDPVSTMSRGRPVTAEQLDAFRRQLGLDRPLWEQFLNYLTGVFRGEFGDSYFYTGVPVGRLIGERIGPTLLLVGTATVLAVLIGLFIGVRAAWRHGSRFDHATTGTALTLWSVPPFWLGQILLMVFAVGAGPIPGLFPVGRMTSPDTPDEFFPQLLDTAHHLVLPSLTLVAAVYAQYQLVMRSSLLEELGADYLTTARAKGLKDEQVRKRHAVPNALLPTVTLIFLHMGMVVSGSIAVEKVYSWPGLGQLTYEALQVPDLPVLQGTFTVLAGSVIAMNVIADLLYRTLDPRVRAA